MRISSLTCLCLIMLLSACVPVVIGGTGAAAFMSGKMITQDKTVGESISDTTIWARIRTGLANRGIDNVLGTVSIEIQEGRVLLTGSVPDKNKIITILRVCWNTNGVKEVINELRVIESKDKPGAFDNIKDAWITTKIKSKLLACREVKSMNYSVESIGGVVYLLGIAQSQQELDAAIDLVSNTANVKKVVSYVKVKKDLSSRVAETKGMKIDDDFDAHGHVYDLNGHENFNHSNEPAPEPVIVPMPPVHSPTRPVVQDETIASTPPAKPETTTKTETGDTIFEKDDF